MNDTGIDRVSVAGKRLSIGETTEVLVVGAGSAGCTAAIAAAERGMRVVLVDENPIDAGSMANDVPLHFGARMSGAVRNRTTMTEAFVAANPLVASAFEAGVDVRLGTTCWGLFLPGPTVRWPAESVAGLVDADSCWHLEFEHVIVATGCRDMGVAFPGWDAPGVMGATALERLARGYGALAATRAVVLGSGVAAMRAIGALEDAGGECVAVIECAERAFGGGVTAQVLDEAGIELLTSNAIARVDADREGVRAVAVTRVDAAGRAVEGTERWFECDTVILAVAQVPCIELLAACGCETVFDAARGGHVPRIDGAQGTTHPAVFVAGDASGVWPAKSSDPALAAHEAGCAVSAITASRGGTQPGPDDAAPPAPPGPSADLDGYLRRWVTASVIEARGEPSVCLCEEVTARDILEVRPPSYLDWEPATQKPVELTAMLGNGPPSPDLVKRLTRAGMGQCQGRRCREQVAVLLALESGLPLADIPLATYRPPVRPLPLGVLAEWNEDPAFAEGWHPWFGIPSQWIPSREVDGPEDAGPGDGAQADTPGRPEPGART